MKKYVFFLVMATVLSFFTSCDMYEDRCGLEVDYSNAWVGFGLVQKDATTGSVTIAMDDGEVLYPAVSTQLWGDLKTNDRVLTNFTIVGNKNNPNHDEHYYVRINSLRKILYKGILTMTTAMEDSIGKNPIHVKDKWIKNNMLNFELQYRGGSKIHYINLVKKAGVVTPEGSPVLLELRHNTNGDTDQLPLSAIVTFDMNSLKVPGKTSTSFKITAKDFDGTTFEYNGEYKY